MHFAVACSIVGYNFAGWGVDDALLSMSEIGFEGVEMNCPREFLERGRGALKRRLDELGLEAFKYLTGGAGVSCGIEELGDSDPDALCRTMEAYLTHLQIAVDNGFQKMVVFPGLDPAGGEGPQRAAKLRRSAENLGEVAEIARRYGVELLVETHAGALAKDHRTFMEMRELSGSDNVYANVDPSNYVVVGQDVCEAVRELRALVRGVHLKDVIMAEGGPYWAPPGSGEVDWAAFLQTLDEVGYHGPLAVEYEAGVTGRFPVDPEYGARVSHRYITGLMP